MKKILSLGLFLLLTLQTLAQTDGITYQAVIIGPDVLQLPGVDSQGNYLPTTTVDIRFTIFDSGNQIEFQEVQTTTTDEFGRINLIIGAVKHDDFEKISWDGTPKDLKVDIDFKNGNNFVDMSREILTFVPYAYHRNITATGTLNVDDDTFLNRELIVNGPTNLNSTLTVHDGNETYLSGRIEVDSIANFNNGLNVNNKSTTNLSGALNVGEATGLPDEDAPTTLNGKLTVVGESSFTGLTVDDLTVNKSTVLEESVAINSKNEQVVITSTLTGSDRDINKYPVKIQGGNQGLAIVVDDDRSNKNNFVSFWDTSTVTSPTLSGETLVQSSPNMWGRIEGEIPSEFDNNADYLFDKASLFYDSADATLDALIQAWDTTIAIAENVAAATAFAPCVGPIPCVVGPPPSWIVSTKAKLVAEGVKSIAVIANGAIVIKQRIDFDNNKDKYQGVTYASGAGDYAEYLLRENIGEEMTYGDIIGIKGGKISKNLIGAERIMVVSYKPIVLGNMPQKNKEDQYEKVAFMGQVPVKVYGKTNIGDYIIPSGKNDGIGIAIAPENIKTNQIKDIVGTAWAENNDGFNLINVAVGINRNDNNFILENLENKVNEQAKEISYLKSQIENILNSLKQGTTVAHKEEVVTNTKLNYQDYTSSKISVVESPEYDIIYLEITKQDLEEGIVLAEKMMKESGDYELNKEIFERLRNDSEFKENFISEIQRKLDKQIHYHKEIDKKGRH